MSTVIEINDQSLGGHADPYYKQWRQLKTIGREVFERGQKKIRLGHPIVCDLHRLLNLYEPINEQAYRCLQQHMKESDLLDAQRIYDWISEEKSALKIEREMAEKAGMVLSDQAQSQT